MLLPVFCPHIVYFFSNCSPLYFSQIYRTELVQNSQEVSSAIVTELIPQSTELLPTTEPPSDSTPEYILNESLEQEAFTILSTYRTPQYSINSLQFL